MCPQADDKGDEEMAEPAKADDEAKEEASEPSAAAAAAEPAAEEAPSPKKGRASRGKAKAKVSTAACVLPF